jgi:hypothetical protein
LFNIGQILGSFQPDEENQLLATNDFTVSVHFESSHTETPAEVTSSIPFAKRSEKRKGSNQIRGCWHSVAAAARTEAQ